MAGKAGDGNVAAIAKKASCDHAWQSDCNADLPTQLLTTNHATSAAAVPYMIQAGWVQRTAQRPANAAPPPNSDERMRYNWAIYDLLPSATAAHGDRTMQATPPQSLQKNPT